MYCTLSCTVQVLDLHLFSVIQYVLDELAVPSFVWERPNWFTVRGMGKGARGMGSAKQTLYVQSVATQVHTKGEHHL